MEHFGLHEPARERSWAENQWPVTGSIGSVLHSLGHPLLSLHGYRMAETKGNGKLGGISSSGAANGGGKPTTPWACRAAFLFRWNIGLQEENTEARWQMTETWLLQDIKLGHYDTFKTLFSSWWFASLQSTRPSLGCIYFHPKERNI